MLGPVARSPWPRASRAPPAAGSRARPAWRRPSPAPRGRAVPSAGLPVVPRPARAGVRATGPGRGASRRAGHGHLRRTGGRRGLGHRRPWRRPAHQLRPAAPGAVRRGATVAGRHGDRHGRRRRSTSGCGSAGATSIRPRSLGRPVHLVPRLLSPTARVPRPPAVRCRGGSRRDRLAGGSGSVSDRCPGR